MTIDSDQFIEPLFLKIRGEMIKFASKIEKETSLTEIRLLQDIKT